jgi:hypothetical protein
MYYVRSGDVCHRTKIQRIIIIMYVGDYSLIGRLLYKALSMDLRRRSSWTSKWPHRISRQGLFVPEARQDRQGIYV